eukprot:gnl/Dysnectes_brevis/2001_a2304_470.p1 GENE.gnl/Dysnectes_brevis/2001_a2304_470~~gnl/Dysnectes_brevis/2001_a2304_470.p1  ORF type:complete len:1816 (-),score=611.63 gnl/Dysnectes_brevis/2001_a2304_470:177-5624(-)
MDVPLQLNIPAQILVSEQHPSFYSDSESSIHQTATTTDSLESLDDKSTLKNIIFVTDTQDEISSLNNSELRSPNRILEKSIVPAGSLGVGQLTTHFKTTHKIHGRTRSGGNRRYASSSRHMFRSLSHNISHRLASYASVLPKGHQLHSKLSLHELSSSELCWAHDIRLLLRAVGLPGTHGGRGPVRVLSITHIAEHLTAPRLQALVERASGQHRLSGQHQGARSVCGCHTIRLGRTQSFTQQERDQRNRVARFDMLLSELRAQKYTDEVQGAFLIPVVMSPSTDSLSLSPSLSHVLSRETQLPVTVTLGVLVTVAPFPLLGTEPAVLRAVPGFDSVVSVLDSLGRHTTLPQPLIRGGRGGLSGVNGHTAPHALEFIPASHASFVPLVELGLTQQASLSAALRRQQLQQTILSNTHLSPSPLLSIPLERALGVSPRAIASSEGLGGSSSDDLLDGFGTRRSSTAALSELSAITRGVPAPKNVFCLQHFLMLGEPTTEFPARPRITLEPHLATLWPGVAHSRREQRILDTLFPPKQSQTQSHQSHQSQSQSQSPPTFSGHPQLSVIAESAPSTPRRDSHPPTSSSTPPPLEMDGWTREMPDNVPAVAAAPPPSGSSPGSVISTITKSSSTRSHLPPVPFPTQGGGASSSVWSGSEAATSTPRSPRSPRSTASHETSSGSSRSSAGHVLRKQVTKYSKWTTAKHILSRYALGGIILACLTHLVSPLSRDYPSASFIDFTSHLVLLLLTTIMMGGQWQEERWQVAVLGGVFAIISFPNETLWVASIMAAQALFVLLCCLLPISSRTQISIGALFGVTLGVVIPFAFPKYAVVMRTFEGNSMICVICGAIDWLLTVLISTGQIPGSVRLSNRVLGSGSVSKNTTRAMELVFAAHTALHNLINFDIDPLVIHRKQVGPFTLKSTPALVLRSLFILEFRAVVAVIFSPQKLGMHIALIILGFFVYILPSASVRIPHRPTTIQQYAATLSAAHMAARQRVESTPLRLWEARRLTSADRMTKSDRVVLDHLGPLIALWLGGQYSSEGGGNLVASVDDLRIITSACAADGHPALLCAQLGLWEQRHTCSFTVPPHRSSSTRPSSPSETPLPSSGNLLGASSIHLPYLTKSSTGTDAKSAAINMSFRSADVTCMPYTLDESFPPLQSSQLDIQRRLYVLAHLAKAIYHTPGSPLVPFTQSLREEDWDASPGPFWMLMNLAHRCRGELEEMAGKFAYMSPADTTFSAMLDAMRKRSVLVWYLFVWRAYMFCFRRLCTEQVHPSLLPCVVGAVPLGQHDLMRALLRQEYHQSRSTTVSGDSDMVPVQLFPSQGKRGAGDPLVMVLLSIGEVLPLIIPRESDLDGPPALLGRCIPAYYDSVVALKDGKLCIDTRSSHIAPLCALTMRTGEPMIGGEGAWIKEHLNLPQLPQSMSISFDSSTAIDSVEHSARGVVMSPPTPAIAPKRLPGSQGAAIYSRVRMRSPSALPRSGQSSGQDSPLPGVETPSDPAVPEDTLWRHQHTRGRVSLSRGLAAGLSCAVVSALFVIPPLPGFGVYEYTLSGRPMFLLLLAAITTFLISIHCGRAFHSLTCCHHILPMLYYMGPMVVTMAAMTFTTKLYINSPMRKVCGVVRDVFPLLAFPMETAVPPILLPMLFYALLATASLITHVFMAYKAAALSAGIIALASFQLIARQPACTILCALMLPGIAMAKQLEPAHGYSPVVFASSFARVIQPWGVMPLVTLARTSSPPDRGMKACMPTLERIRPGMLMLSFLAAQLFACEMGIIYRVGQCSFVSSLLVMCAFIIIRGLFVACRASKNRKTQENELVM